LIPPKPDAIGHLCTSHPKSCARRCCFVRPNATGNWAESNCLIPSPSREQLATWLAASRIMSWRMMRRLRSTNGLPVTDVSICSRETMSQVRSNFPSARLATAPQGRPFAKLRGGKRESRISIPPTQRHYSNFDNARSRTKPATHHRARTVGSIVSCNVRL